MDFFDIGTIINTHGIKGEVRVYPLTDEPERFKKLKQARIFLRGQEFFYDIESAKLHKQFVILKLKGIESIEDANKLRDGVIKIERKDAIELEEDEYFAKDLYNMLVVLENGEELGILTDIIITGANDVYVVRSEGKKDILIPAIKQCILNVDVKNKKMTVHLLKGLRDE
ncbi:MAG: ribosome maturation factor RimM [Defluviitaleaceae bacterium]|nr:ribosome maturation factor RimM [Defluviitaleaceae bacterium]